MATNLHKYTQSSKQEQPPYFRLSKRCFFVDGNGKFEPCTELVPSSRPRPKVRRKRSVYNDRGFIFAT